MATRNFTIYETEDIFSCRGAVIGKTGKMQKEPGGTMIWESCLPEILSGAPNLLVKVFDLILNCTSTNEI